MDKRSYPRLVWDQGQENTKEYYHKDQRGWIYNIGSAILVSVISPPVYGFIGLIAPNQFWLSIWADLASGAIFFVIWRIFIFVYFLVNAPAKLYRQKKEKQANLYTWNDTEITECYLRNTCRFGAGIRLYSHKTVRHFALGSIRVETIRDFNKTFVYRNPPAILMPFVCRTTPPELEWAKADIERDGEGSVQKQGTR